MCSQRTAPACASDTIDISRPAATSLNLCKSMDTSLTLDEQRRAAHRPRSVHWRNDEVRTSEWLYRLTLGTDGDTPQWTVRTKTPSAVELLVDRRELAVTGFRLNPPVDPFLQLGLALAHAD